MDSRKDIPAPELVIGTDNILAELDKIPLPEVTIASQSEVLTQRKDENGVPGIDGLEVDAKVSDVKTVVLPHPGYQDTEDLEIAELEKGKEPEAEEHVPGVKPKGMPQALWNLLQKAKTAGQMIGYHKHFGNPPKDKLDFMLKKSTKKNKSRRKTSTSSKRRNR